MAYFCPLPSVKQSLSIETLWCQAADERIWPGGALTITRLVSVDFFSITQVFPLPFKRRLGFINFSGCGVINESRSAVCRLDRIAFSTRFIPNSLFTCTIRLWLSVHDSGRVFYAYSLFRPGEGWGIFDQSMTWWLFSALIFHWDNLSWNWIPTPTRMFAPYLIAIVSNTYSLWMGRYVAVYS